MTAIFKHGSPLMVDHTPSAAVAAREVVEMGTYNLVAHSAIAAAAKGALAAGGGVYEMIAGEQLTAGEKVFYDHDHATLSGRVHSDDSGTASQPHFGYTLEAASAAAATVLCVHDPDGSVSTGAGG